jgi:hypothetical protein
MEHFKIFSRETPNILHSHLCSNQLPFQREAILTTTTFYLVYKVCRDLIIPRIRAQSCQPRYSVSWHWSDCQVRCHSTYDYLSLLVVETFQTHVASSLGRSNLKLKVGKSSTLVSQCWGLLHHTQAGLGIVKSRRYFSNLQKNARYSWCFKANSHRADQALTLLSLSWRVVSSAFRNTDCNVLPHAMALLMNGLF